MRGATQRPFLIVSRRSSCTLETPGAESLVSWSLSLSIARACSAVPSAPELTHVLTRRNGASRLGCTAIDSSDAPGLWSCIYTNVCAPACLFSQCYCSAQQHKSLVRREKRRMTHVDLPGHATGALTFGFNINTTTEDRKLHARERGSGRAVGVPIRGRGLARAGAKSERFQPGAWTSALLSNSTTTSAATSRLRSGLGPTVAALAISAPWHLAWLGWNAGPFATDTNASQSVRSVLHRVLQEYAMHCTAAACSLRPDHLLLRQQRLLHLQHIHLLHRAAALQRHRRRHPTSVADDHPGRLQHHKQRHQPLAEWPRKRKERQLSVSHLHPHSVLPHVAHRRLRHPGLKLNMPPWLFCKSWCPDFEFRRTHRHWDQHVRELALLRQQRVVRNPVRRLAHALAYSCSRDYL